uniref:Uncharacterized protein n=1 Tax=Glossina palpalis gambiensis TaxID=67801 RepID=A0A1B0BI00_9MUSC
MCSLQHGLWLFGNLPENQVVKVRDDNFHYDLVDLRASHRSAGSLLSHNNIFQSLKVQNFMFTAKDKCKILDVAFRSLVNTLKLP